MGFNLKKILTALFDERAAVDKGHTGRNNALPFGKRRTEQAAKRGGRAGRCGGRRTVGDRRHICASSHDIDRDANQGGNGGNIRRIGGVGASLQPSAKFVGV